MIVKNKLFQKIAFIDDKNRTIIILPRKEVSIDSTVTVSLSDLEKAGFVKIKK